MGIVNGSTGRVVDFMRPKEFRREIKIHPQWVIVSSLEPRQTKTTPPEQPSVQRPILHRNWKSKKESEWYEGIEWPVVQFPDGMCAMMGPVSFTMENRENKVEVERLQVRFHYLCQYWAKLSRLGASYPGMGVDGKFLASIIG